MTRTERRLAACVGVGLGLAPAAASAQTLSIDNQAGASPLEIARVERAAQDVINGPLHQAYPAVPTVVFGEGGWRIALMPASSWVCPWTQGCWGYHQETQPPQAVVRWDNNNLHDSEYVLAHEYTEMMADPYGQNPEICDPVTWQTSTVDGVIVADFVRSDGSVWSVPTTQTASQTPTPTKHRRHRHKRRHRHR